ncbi:LysM peptidoglycan-binding domain-containing protein [Geodermatophilus poikilotrophus]|uniref:LysM domain-containing protein n=1 Tax=Geodermatophilus poikilotrophus TaxID=1333667 RepID=A0A1I0CGJ9_9ACTN|nr:LysM peptidoglycan-binding domain-containing protein [Geodermatophilus poikilotrophus]SET18543.1 LysM domain-containing protein [Geodermatophilus poikilotrophus]
MASVRQAVLEFDAAVRVPWRPLLGSGTGGGAPASGPATAGLPGAAGQATRSVLPGSGPRVAGHLRPVPDCPVGREPRGAGPVTEAPRTRRDPARPGGRPLRSAPAAGAVRGGCAPAPASVRLTRRGRRFVAALALGGAVALGASIAPLADGADGGLHLAGESSVEVQPGDTVWSIAGEVAGDGQDVRVVVDAIEELNDLEGSVVVPGQVLELP